MEDVVSRIAQRREEYYAMGQRLGIPTRPSSTNFVLFDLGDSARATRVVADLLAHGIHVRKPPVPPLDRFVRISIGSLEDHIKLEEALVGYKQHGGSRARETPVDSGSNVDRSTAESL